MIYIGNGLLPPIGIFWVYVFPMNVHLLFFRFTCINSRWYFQTTHHERSDEKYRFKIFWK